MEKERGINIVVVGNVGVGSSTSIHLAEAIAKMDKDIIIIDNINEVQRNPVFEPEPFVLRCLPKFDMIDIDVNSNKKWFNHYDKFKKGKNKFGRKK